ncbi:eukaryotic translation initiation factor 5B-like protein [Tanacetum coccineum]
MSSISINTRELASPCSSFCLQGSLHALYNSGSSGKSNNRRGGCLIVKAESVSLLTKDLKADAKIKVIGLFVIDTPGHESFNNIRSRGSSLCDVAILVVDNTNGLQPQTIESIKLVKMKNTDLIENHKPSVVVALNKVNRLYGWKTCPDVPIANALKLQSTDVHLEFKDKVTKVTLNLESLPSLHDKVLAAVLEACLFLMVIEHAGTIHVAWDERRRAYGLLWSYDPMRVSHIYGMWRLHGRESFDFQDLNGMIHYGCAFKSNRPRDPLVVDAFSLAVHNGGDMKEAIDITQIIFTPHTTFYDELKGLKKEVLELGVLVSKALSNITDSYYVSQGMRSYRKAPKSDMVRTQKVSVANQQKINVNNDELAIGHPLGATINFTHAVCLSQTKALKYLQHKEDIYCLEDYTAQESSISQVSFCGLLKGSSSGEPQPRTASRVGAGARNGLKVGECHV